MKCISALVLVAALALALTDAQQQSTQQQQISDKYGSSSKAAAVRNALPRVYGPKLDPAQIEHWTSSDQQGYAIQIGAFIAPGVFFLLFTILGFPLFCCFRYCCNCCCGCRDARKGGYLSGEKWKPYIALAVMGAGLIAFGITGYVSSEQLDHALVGEGSSSTSPGISSSLLGLVDGALGMIKYLNTSLGTLADGTQPVVDEANHRLDATADNVVRIGTQGLVDRLNTFSRNINNLTITVTADPGSEGLVPNVTYPCAYCVNAAAGLSATANQVRDTADSTISSLNDTVRNVKELLIDGQTQLKKYTGDAYSQVTDAEGQVRDVRKQAADLIDDYIKPYEEKRRQAVLGLFCLPLLTALTIVIGGVLKNSGHPFTFTCGLTWLSFLLLSLLLMIHLPLSMLFADSCLIIEYGQENVANFTGADAAKFIDTCLTNASLTDAYNLTDKLSLSDLSFPTLPNITDVFANFTDLDRTNRDVQALNLTTFGFDPAQVQTSLNSLNTHTASYESPHFAYTVNNVSACDPNLAPNSTVRATTIIYKYQTLEYIDAQLKTNATLMAIKANMSEIVAYNAELRANFSRVQDSVRGIETLANPLIATAKDLARGVTCGFVGDAYLDVKNAFCQDVVASMSVMSFMCFLILTFSIPVLVISVILSTRFPAKEAKLGPDGKIMEDHSGADGVDGAIAGNSTDAGAPASLPLTDLKTTKFAADGSIIVESAPAQPATGAGHPGSGHASTNSVVLDVPQHSSPVTQKAFDSAPAYVPPPSAAANVTVPNYNTYASPNSQTPAIPAYDAGGGAGGAAGAAAPSSLAPPLPPMDGSAAPAYGAYNPAPAMSPFGAAPAYVPSATPNADLAAGAGAGTGGALGAPSVPQEQLPGTVLPPSPYPAHSGSVGGGEAAPQGQAPEWHA